VRWDARLIEFAMHSDVPQDLWPGDVTAAVERAAATWRETECGEPGISAPKTTTLPAAPGDGVNTIQWIKSGWVERGLPRDAAGATDVQYERASGGEWRIVEADVYLNAELFRWLPAGEGPEPDYRSVLSVLTHEMGHVLGLMHPCEPGGSGGAPDCSSHSEMQGVTMYPLYSVAQSELSEDDTAGVCFLYDPCAFSECTPPDGGIPPDGGTPDAGAGHLVKPDGEQCATDVECAGGKCADGGRCARVCHVDSDCGGGFCVSGACTSRGADAGAQCAESTDCASGLCVLGRPSGGFCSNACTEATQCSAGWECTDVDGTFVCAPPDVQAAGGGCAVPAPPVGTSLPWPLLALAALARRFRRKR
jgi:MYXO-CTERM domain-containing protein